MNTVTPQDLIETAKTFLWRAALEGDPNEGGDRKLAAWYAAIAQAHAATAQAMIDLARYEDERADAEREERRKIWSARPMTNPNPPARLFRLTSWERIESLAAQHGAIAKSGPNAGKPSVHTMLAAIEAGALDVVAAEPAQPAETAPQPAATT